MDRSARIPSRDPPKNVTTCYDRYDLNALSGSYKKASQLPIFIHYVTTVTTYLYILKPQDTGREIASEALGFNEKGG